MSAADEYMTNWINRIPFAKEANKYVKMMIKSPVSWIEVNTLAQAPKNNRETVINDCCPIDLALKFE